ncbi:MAG: threonyl-tRNA synthetase, partial [Sphingobacteriales bacterium]
MIKITFPDNRVQEYEKGINALDIARGISEGLMRNVLAAKVNGEICDAFSPINEDATLELLTWDSEGGKMAFWHSSAHVLAEALEELYPGVKLGIGPPIDNGFYYDVDLGEKVLTAEELPAIEKKMKELAKKKNRFLRREVSKAEAIEYFTKKGDEYKLELIEGLEDGSITFYEQGNFTDLCKGPHIPSTGGIKAVKLLTIAGAYWRGDVSRKQLTRIYGVTFPKAAMLEEHLALLEEAKKRDHRRLGKELDLFTFSDKVGQGLPLWLPKGAELREQLEQFLRKAQRTSGYQQVITPHIGSKELY